MTPKVILEPGEDGWIVAHVPALRGCVSQGRTREEAIVNTKDALQGWLEVEQEKEAALDEQAETVAVAV